MIRKNRIGSFSGHHPCMCVWVKWNIHYMLLPQPLKGNRSVASFKGSSTVTERSSGDPINLFSEIIRWSNWLFNLHFSFQGFSLLALCPAMQKRSPTPRGCRQAGIQDNDEEVPSWWQCHTLRFYLGDIVTLWRFYFSDIVTLWQLERQAYLSGQDEDALAQIVVIWLDYKDWLNYRVYLDVVSWWQRKDKHIFQDKMT